MRRSIQKSRIFGDKDVKRMTKRISDAVDKEIKKLKSRPKKTEPFPLPEMGPVFEITMPDLEHIGADDRRNRVLPGIEVRVPNPNDVETSQAIDIHLEAFPSDSFNENDAVFGGRLERKRNGQVSIIFGKQDSFVEHGGIHLNDEQIFARIIGGARIRVKP